MYVEVPDDSSVAGMTSSSRGSGDSVKLGSHVPRSPISMPSYFNVFSNGLSLDTY